MKMCEKMKLEKELLHEMESEQSFFGRFFAAVALAAMEREEPTYALAA
ncbi:MAG: hypothetical protein LBN05_05585 [Oscillospiraceae bacterium]|jgi:hypothetical protein|nr:hypothetical protein [Oscillospiraceae bacterium]